MAVAVISRTGTKLMPTSEYRARRLLKSGKAVRHSFDPFTIRLTEREDGDVQSIEVCVDTGYIHIGISDRRTISPAANFGTGSRRSNLLKVQHI